MPEEVFNRKAFYSHLGGDLELGAEILLVYIDDAPQRADSLASALDQDDPSMAVKYAHALKGISATIRAERMAMLAEEAERSARKGDLNSVKSLLPRMMEELDLVLKSVKAAL